METFSLYIKYIFYIIILLETPTTISPYTTPHPNKTCGGYVNTNVIRHPENGGNYSNNEDCTWHIQTNHTGLYRLHFTMFSTERNYDWVRIGNLKYSGSSNPAEYFFNDSTTLRFTSDSSNTGYGFKVEIIEVKGKFY